MEVIPGDAVVAVRFISTPFALYNHGQGGQTWYSVLLFLIVHPYYSHLLSDLYLLWTNSSCKWIREI